jgi:hypothetical protein
MRAPSPRTLVVRLPGQDEAAGRRIAFRGERVSVRID